MNGRFRSPKPISRATLLRVAEAARLALLPDRDAEEGDCQPVSEEIVRRLRRMGHDAFMVVGAWRGRPHAWVRVGGLCVDATHDQHRHYVGDAEEEALLDRPVRVWKADSDEDYR